jgi:CDP-6-deoxy-D-xylo-4-hexulose-3-dehydrase
MQAAVGVAQLKKLPDFITARKRNHERLSERLEKHADRLILHSFPEGADPSWFGYVITVRPESGVKGSHLVHALEGQNVETRNLFCGNLLRHPAYKEVVHRVAEPLTNTEVITDQTFFVGVYPGLREHDMDTMADIIDEALAD